MHAGMMRVFRACPRGLIPGLLTRYIPWWQGRKQGISPIQPFSAKYGSRIFVFTAFAAITAWVEAPCEGP
jgi:hypothetical protein